VVAMDNQLMQKMVALKTQWLLLKVNDCYGKSLDAMKLLSAK
jgi:hypothetical protein